MEEWHGRGGKVWRWAYMCDDEPIVPAAPVPGGNVFLESFFACLTAPLLISSVFTTSREEKQPGGNGGTVKRKAEEACAVTLEWAER